MYCNCLNCLLHLFFIKGALLTELLNQKICKEMFVTMAYTFSHIPSSVMLHKL